MRHERLRFYLSGICSIAFIWCAFRGLEWIVNQFGIITRIHYSTPNKQWSQIGESWQLIDVGMDFSDAGIILFAPTLALAYYLTRLIYFLDFRKAFPTRRDPWLLAGWLIGSSTIIAEKVLLSTLLSNSALMERWPTVTSYTVLGIIVVSARFFSDGWALLMKRCIPDPDWNASSRRTPHD